MKCWWKGATALILSLTMASAIHAVQVYDIANPSIQKTVLAVKAAEDTAKNQALVERLKGLGIRVSLFADPSPEGLDIAKRLGADRVELYTGPYGECLGEERCAHRELQRLIAAAQQAQALGLGLNAGHDLTVQNLTPLAMSLPMLDEVSIGHGLTADALSFGMAETVKRFLRALGERV